MATQVIQGTQIEIRETHRFTAAERYMLKRFHPRRIMADVISSAWAVYFVWRNDWVSAVAVVLIIGALAFYSVRNTDPEAMSKTILGKIALLHLHPVNMALQLAGLIPLVYGIWIHSAEFILTGLSLVFAGHLLGWTRVDGSFSQKHAWRR